uniref:Uncharacterized protein n=1 Tax=Tanacetum cinerariifolium TaxID=118510 RepID=A0A6L2ML75_TANCI|nr:hypothetical protein [Tanacetum cinerariifolium]
MSIVASKSLEDLEAQENVNIIKKHLVDEEIEKIVEGGDNVDEDEFMAGDALIRRNKQENGKEIEEIRDTLPPTSIRSPRTYISPLSSDKEKLQELMASKPTASSTPKPKSSNFNAISKDVHATLKEVVPKMVDHNTNDFMKNNLPKAVAQAIRRKRQRVKDDIATMVAEVVQKERENIKVELYGHVTNDVTPLNLVGNRILNIQGRYFIDQ